MRTLTASEHSERTHWWVILALTALFGLLFCSLVSGKDRSKSKEPKMLPVQILVDAIPMDQYKEPALTDSGWMREGAEAYASDEYEKAIYAWQQVRLEGEARVWIHLALARTYLEIDDVDAVRAELLAASTVAPDHPVAHMLRAFLYIKEAKTAPPSLELPRHDGTIFVSTQNPLVPYTKPMLHFAARQELTKAIAHASQLNVELMLTVDDELGECGMTADELLTILELDNWLAQSHLALGRLYTMNRTFDAAERHLDAARELELPCAASYRRLADKLEVEKAWADATRIHAKSAAAGGSLLQAWNRILDNAESALSPPR